MQDFAAQFDAAAAALRYARDHAVDQQLAASAAELGGAARSALLDHLMETDHPLYHVAEAAASGVERDKSTPFNGLHVAYGGVNDEGTHFRYLLHVAMPETKNKTYNVEAVLPLQNTGGKKHKIATQLSPATLKDTLLRVITDNGSLAERSNRAVLERLYQLHPELAE